MNEASEKWARIGLAQFEASNIVACRRPISSANMLFLVFCCCLNLFVSAQQDPTAALCQQQIDTLSNITNYTALYSSVLAYGAQNGNDISYTADFSSASVSVKAACTTEGGQIYKTNEIIACDYNTNGMQGKLFLFFMNLGLCVGKNCSTSYLDASFQQWAAATDALLSQSVNNITQNLSANGFTNCAVSFSSSSRVFVLMTGFVTVAVTLLAHLVVDFMA